MPSVLVTGAARGIGRTTAIQLAERGWDVFAGVRRLDDGEALTHDQPSRISPVLLDITDADQVAGLDQVLPPELDALVNNAGVVIGGPVEAVPVSVAPPAGGERCRPGGGHPGSAVAAAPGSGPGGVRVLTQRKDRHPAHRAL